MAKAVLQSNIQASDAGLTVAAGATVTIRNSDTLGLATLYTTRAGTTTTANPTTADADGFFRVYLDPGRYNVTATYSGDTQTFNDVVAQENSPIVPVENVTALKAISPIDDYVVYLKGHTTVNDGGGGEFIGVTGAAPGTYIDDNGVTILPTGGDGSAAWVRAFSGRVHAGWFGVLFDNSTDNAVALQSFVTYVTSNSLQGQFPGGTCLTSATINVATTTYNWGFFGVGMGATIIEQTGNNIPIFDIGESGGSLVHTWTMQDIGFDYSVSQTGNTSAACLYISAQDNFSIKLERIKFHGGYWGIKVRPTSGGPWACSWNDLEWSRFVVGGAMDWTGAVNAVPNNRWGRFNIDVRAMVDGTIFKELKGYNWTWGALEIFGGLTNQRIMSLQATSDIQIGSIKVELVTLNGAIDGGALITAPTNGYMSIDSIRISGTYCILTPTSATALLLGSHKLLKVNYITITPTAAVSNFYVATVSGRTVIDTIVRDATYPVPYTNLGGTASADYLTIPSIANDQLSADKGDADYTVTLGDPNNIRYETTLTAIRTVTLPGADGDLFNGMRYRVISEGAINGANTIDIWSDGASRATLTVDDSFVELMYRRSPTGGGGWTVIGRGTI